MHAETAAWWWLVKLPSAGYSVSRLSGTTDEAGYARLASRDPRRRTPGSTFAGGHRSRAPPVPIPNTEVKPATADGTVWETAWESRSLPALIPEARCARSHRAFFASELASLVSLAAFSLSPQVAEWFAMS